MDLEKGISYIAFGFLFTLVNLNLTFNGATVNFMPSFIGWFLIFLACGEFGEYSDEKPYLKWFALVLALCSAAVWMLETFKPELLADTIKTVVACAEAICMFILFGVLENIAGDLNSSRAGTISFLKYFNLIIYIAFAGLTILGAALNNDGLILTGVFAGFLCLAAAIYTMFVLFGLRKEVKNTL